MRERADVLQPAFLFFSFPAKKLLTCASVKPSAAGEEPTDLDTIVFSIVVACDYRKGAPSGAKDPDLLYSNSSGASW